MTTAAIIACEMIADETLLALERAWPAANRPPLVWIESSLHERPTKLKAALQELIDQLDAGARTGESVTVHGVRLGEGPAAERRELVKVEPVGDLLLGFGYCGGGLEGLVSRERRLALLAADDCIGALLCRDCETGQVERDAHSYYFTSGWLRHPGFVGSVDDWLKKHGPEKARRMWRLMFAGYERVSLIDTGAYNLEEWLPRSLARAAEWELQHCVVPGSVEALAQLFAGQWDGGGIIVLEPGQSMGLEYLLSPTARDTNRPARSQAQGG